MKYASHRGFCQMEPRNFLDDRLESERRKGAIRIGPRTGGATSSGTSFFLILDVATRWKRRNRRRYIDEKMGNTRRRRGSGAREGARWIVVKKTHGG